MTESSSSTEESVNKTKWGNIAILVADNFPLFDLSCRVVLKGAGCWNIVTGDFREPPVDPKAVHDAWIASRELALQLLCSSVHMSLFTDAMGEGFQQRDPALVWAEIQRKNQISNRLYTHQMRTEFYSTTFNPEHESITSLHQRLLQYKAMLATTDRPITETDVLEVLLRSIPDDQQPWAAQKRSCIQNNLDLSTTIIALQLAGGSSLIKPNLPTTYITCTADMINSSCPHTNYNHTSGDRGGASRFQGVRSRSRVARRGDRQNDRYRSHSNRGNSARFDSRGGDKKACNYCSRAGHRERECRTKAAAVRELKETARTSNEHGSVVRATSSAQYSNYDYSSAHIVTEDALHSFFLLLFFGNPYLFQLISPGSLNSIRY
jgi:hypothetical protein